MNIHSVSSLALFCLQTVRDWTLHLLLEMGNKCILAVCHISSHVFSDMFLPVVGQPCCMTILTGLVSMFWPYYRYISKRTLEPLGRRAVKHGLRGRSSLQIRVPHPWAVASVFAKTMAFVQVSTAWVNVSVYFHYKWYQQMFSTWRTVPWNECFQTRKAKVFMRCFASVKTTVKHWQNGTFCSYQFNGTSCPCPWLQHLRPSIRHNVPVPIERGGSEAGLC